ncbi:hypothetical protein CHS0354_010199 [Potamilus streckersoni]|uniref:F-BAR domain-containing protein n=1 Tax=Potamilus streckersoni TaxID=2493646 RepID=A0AAE0RSK0_9BIVA|nr:hypothetical protein CHS0354_010199 [Potamilus streckersoni]
MSFGFCDLLKQTDADDIKVLLELFPFRSVNMLAKMMEERFKCEEKMAHALQNNSCDWTKKLADISSAGNGEFDHGSIYVAITKALMEPIEDAKIYNIVKNEGLDDDGPVSFLRSWKAHIESSQIQNKTMKLYSTAWEKQQSTQKEIQKAKEYYHLRKYKLEYGLRQLHADPPVLSSRAEAKLQKSMDRYRVKCEDAQKEYKKLLKMAEEGRGKDIADMKKAERKFVRFEKNRLMNTAAGIDKFLDMVEKLDTERSSHINVIQDIIGVLKKMNIEAETRNIETQYLNRCKFPVFEDFDEKNPKQQDQIKTWLKKLKLGIRKRNHHGINREVILSDESDPNLVQALTISDDDSDDVKVITTPSDTEEDDDEESDTDIFYIDDKGRESKMKSKPQLMTTDVRAVRKHEKLNSRTGINVQAVQKEDCFGLPNAIESYSEIEMWAIPTRNRIIELDKVYQDTSPLPHKVGCT